MSVQRAVKECVSIIEKAPSLSGFHVAVKKCELL